MQNRGCWWALGIFGAVVALALACGIGVIIGGSSSTILPFGQKAVAVIEVNGTISGGDGGGDLFGGATGAFSGRIIKQLKQAANDPQVGAIVLRVDSPGGGVTPSDEIHNQIMKIRDQKPIIVSMGSLAASGGYYISAPARRIFANPTTLTGSIGVISIVPEVSDLLGKLGVSMYVFTSGPHKDTTDGLRPLTDSDKAIMQGIIDETYGRFVSVVAQGRGLDEATVRRLADGRIYTGQQALNNKLVDELGDLPEAIDYAAKQAGISGTPRVITYQQPGLLGALTSSWFQPPWQQAAAQFGLDAANPLQYRYIP